MLKPIEEVVLHTIFYHTQFELHLANLFKHLSLLYEYVSVFQTAKGRNKQDSSRLAGDDKMATAFFVNIESNQKLIRGFWSNIM